MNPTVIFALVIAIECGAVIAVIVGICFLIWGDFSEPGTQRRVKLPQTTTTKRATRGTTAAPTAPVKATVSSAVAAPASPPKIDMTKTAPSNIDMTKTALSKSADRRNE